LDRRAAPITRGARITLGFAFAAAACFAVGSALHIQSASYTAIPFWDFWSELGTVRKAHLGTLGIGDLWAQHNEHRILLSRLQFIADYALFGGQLVSLLAAIVVSSAVLALVLAWPITSVWGDRTVTLGFFAVALLATLSPLGWENLTWPFQVGFVQAYMFAMAAIAFAVCSLHAEHAESAGRHRLGLIWLVVLATAATYSLANGLVVWPILVLIIFIRRIGARSTGFIAAAGAGVTASYLWGYKPVRAHTPYSESLEHPLGMAHYVAVFLGHPAQLLGSKAEEGVGCVGVVVFLGLLWMLLRDRTLREHPAALFGTAASMFAFATAIQTALGRLEFGVGQALSSRYSIAAAVFWVSLAAGVAPLVRRHAEIRLRSKSGPIDVTGFAFVTLCLAVALGVNLSANPSEALLSGIQTRSEPMLAAFVAGVEDDRASLATFPDAAALPPLLRWLRARQLGPWDAGLGDALRAAQRRIPHPSALAACTGSIDSTAPVHGGRRFDGWIATSTRTPTLRGLDVIDGRGSSVGVGLIGFYRPDVKVARASTSNFRGFVAYARGARRVSGLVLLSSRSQAPLCVLRTV
jgi:hypothetical protein